jgi:GrpB-like predicted nucleotidyltransferase (UPF0157 family)
MAEARLTFVWSDVVAEEAAAVFAAHALRIRQRVPHVEIRHHGGTSVPGLLTSGDVDLHVRSDRQWFKDAQEVLSELYEPLFRDEWDLRSSACYPATAASPARNAEGTRPRHSRRFPTQPRSPTQPWSA